MIPTGVAVYVALEPVDMRYSFERLSGFVTERIGYEARSGALFVFYGKRKDALKVLFFDGSGLCVFYKRLDRGTFKLPDAPAEAAARRAPRRARDPAKARNPPSNTASHRSRRRLRRGPAQAPYNKKWKRALPVASATQRESRPRRT